MIICKDCGMQNLDSDIFCCNCGSRLEKSLQGQTVNKQSEQNEPLEIEPISFSADKNAESSNKKLIIIIVCSLVIILLIGVIVYFVLSENEKKPAENENQYTQIYNGYSDDFIENDTTKVNDSGTQPVNSDEVNRFFYTNPDLSVSASSQLEDYSGFNYSPDNLFDGNNNTCWAEGASDGGINQSIFIKSHEEIWIKSISITNGYCKNYELYRNNNRVKKIKISFDDKELYFDLSDNFDNPVNILSFEPVKTSSITITIIDIYAGKKWNDTCISEISVNPPTP